MPPKKTSKPTPPPPAKRQPQNSEVDSEYEDEAAEDTYIDTQEYTQEYVYSAPEDDFTPPTPTRTKGRGASRTMDNQFKRPGAVRGRGSTSTRGRGGVVRKPQSQPAPPPQRQNFGMKRQYYNANEDSRRSINEVISEDEVPMKVLAQNTRKYVYRTFSIGYNYKMRTARVRVTKNNESEDSFEFEALQFINTKDDGTEYPFNVNVNCIPQILEACQELQDEGYPGE